MKNLFMTLLAAGALLGGAARAAEPLDDCKALAGTSAYATTSCARKSQPDDATMTLVERQSVAIERVDQKIASIRSEIATRKMERKEAIAKVYNHEGVPEATMKKRATEIEADYQRKIDSLSQDLAVLGAERNQLVEHSSRTILEARGQH